METIQPGKYEEYRKKLTAAAAEQNAANLQTINLIAPASPTPPWHIETPLKNEDIAEGLLGHRPYAGAKSFNEIEQIAADLACQVFGAEHANVQPHSVSQANQAVYQALLANGDTVLAMGFAEGGHLTHGHPVNFSGRNFDFQFYGVDAGGIIDYAGIEAQARELKPKMIVCGGSSYPRGIDFVRLGTIARDNGAYLVADLSHPAGLIAAGVYPQPFPECDVVTLTLDKTGFGPHGGMVLCKEELAAKIDKAVHPGVQSSVPLRRMYEMAQTMIDMGTGWFAGMMAGILANMAEFEAVFKEKGRPMVTGGSDTHLMVVNTMAGWGLTGRDAEGVLESTGILTNRQVIPGETQKPYIASGIRLGTTWITGRGYKPAEAHQVATLVDRALSSTGNEDELNRVRQSVQELIGKERSGDVWK